MHVLHSENAVHRKKHCKRKVLEAIGRHFSDVRENGLYTLHTRLSQKVF